MIHADESGRSRRYVNVDEHHTRLSVGWSKKWPEVNSSEYASAHVREGRCRSCVGDCEIKYLVSHVTRQPRPLPFQPISCCISALLQETFIMSVHAMQRLCSLAKTSWNWTWYLVSLTNWQCCSNFQQVDVLACLSMWLLRAEWRIAWTPLISLLMWVESWVAEFATQHLSELICCVLATIFTPSMVRPMAIVERRYCNQLGYP